MDRLRQDKQIGMHNIFTEYPAVPWKQGWRLTVDSDETNPIITAQQPGDLTPPDASWTLSLIPPSIPCDVRLFSQGLSIHAQKRSHEKTLELLLIQPGVLLGETKGFSTPTLRAEKGLTEKEGLSWVQQGEQITLLLYKAPSFALVTGNFPKELALLKAEEAVEEPFNTWKNEATEQRLRTAQLFSMNPRHNPPVALASESLRNRLRNRTAALHGLWSMSDRFKNETFSLNELYPLTRAWLLIDPDVALQLNQTALSLQQATGGFPEWVEGQGASSSSAPWPLIIQSFELVWQETQDPSLLKRTLPALRKYMQWALRRFDPHRDQIPSWQSDQEVFIPGNFDRDKATPDLTVLLIRELDSLMRLCTEFDHSEAAIHSLKIDQEKLTHTLTSIFWNPELKSFSNVWKNGHFSHEPTFGSFLPLLCNHLTPEFKTPLLEQLEETRGFPGKNGSVDRKQIDGDETTHLPAIHQFMAFEALRCADEGRGLLLRFVRRSREGFAAWFERESIEAARLMSHNEPTEHPAFYLGPVSAALTLTTQYEFQHEISRHAPNVKNLLKRVHKLRLHLSDLRLVLGVGLTMLIVHLIYNIPHKTSAETHVAEAAINYQQGHFREALKLCQQYPENPLSRFLQANLMMLIENPEPAEELYHQALLQETESPSLLFGYALCLQMNGKFDLAIRRYNDFIDIHEDRLTQSGQRDLIDFAYSFIRLAEEEFKKPPKWKKVYALPIMGDLGL